MATTRTTIRKGWTVGRAPDYEEMLRKAKEAVAAEALAKAQEEAERLKKLPLSQPTTEGKYEARIVQALVEIMTGRPTVARPQLISMPDTIYEPIALVLSSTEQFYYRVTQCSCTCKGWYYSKERYNVGKCRHHTLAFPELAAQNEKIIEGMKAEKKASKLKMRVSNEIRDLSKAELDDLKGKVEAELGGKYTLFRYAHVKADGIQNLTLRYDYKEDYTEQEEAQVNEMIKAAKALMPQGVEVYAGCL